MEIKTWADFGALSEEDRAAYSPEDLEALKTSITEHEASIVAERQKKDEEAAKNKELAENYKIRAEKAEGKVKELDKKDTALSPKDILLLSKEDINEEEDIDEVIKFADYNKISVADALKNKTLKTILADRAEERASAHAAQTRGQRPAVTTTDESLKERLSKGEVPEAGSKEAEQLFWARRGGKRE